jgi:hypothetical protein
MHRPGGVAAWMPIGQRPSITPIWARRVGDNKLWFGDRFAHQ